MKLLYYEGLQIQVNDAMPFGKYYTMGPAIYMSSASYSFFWIMAPFERTYDFDIEQYTAHARRYLHAYIDKLYEEARTKLS